MNHMDLLYVYAIVAVQERTGLAPRPIGFFFDEPAATATRNKLVAQKKQLQALIRREKKKKSINGIKGYLDDKARLAIIREFRTRNLDKHIVNEYANYIVIKIQEGIEQGIG